MMCSSGSSFVERPIAVLMARWASSEPSAPRVAAPRRVAVKIRPVHVVLSNGAQVGKQATKGAYHLYLVQAPRHVHIREHG
jgi:hypothetical protein